MHTSVLAEPAVQWLAVRPGGIYVDATAGAGGHTAHIVAALAGQGRIIALDRDPEAVARVRTRFASESMVTVVHGNYGDLRNILDALTISSVDGILIDAGVSSPQIDSPERGFSFQADGPLDMRMDTSKGVTAAEWLAHTPESEVANALRLYGDVKPARPIAAALKAASPQTTADLRQAICDALSFVSGEPAEVRTVFQAVRIAVNDELRWLEEGVQAAIDVLNPGGRLVVISFHSGEDRVVKNALRSASRKRDELYPDGRLARRVPPRLKLLTRKPVTPSAEEMAMNPRAHSAKLRAAERVKGGDD